MADKQLIIVVEGTSALGPYWNTIVSDYLEKIIRSFCGNNMTIQKSSASAASDSTFELALVVFNTHGPYSAYLVRRSGWTRDVDNFFGWLSNLSFSGGGWDDVATTEGLAEALMMFAIPQNGYQAQQNVEGRRHCVLVSASNPYTLPTPVYRPKIKKLEPAENGEKQKNNYLYDAETVSKWFGQCCVSLSVICPKQLPKLRAIYNAAKCSQKTSEPAIDVKQPHFLVLLSDSFIEACAALSRSDMPQSQKPVSTLPPGSGLSVSSPLANGTTLNRPPISTGNVPQHPIKEEPVNSIGSQPAHPHMPSMPHRAAPTVSSSQASSPPVSQDIITNNDGVPEIKPIVSMPQSLQANGTVLNITSGVQSATGSTLPTPGMPQQPQGMQSVGMNGSVSNMPPSQQGSTSLSASQSKYIKVWEGNLSGLKQGQPVFITKLEGYRNATASATIAADWPPIMQLARLISQDYMNNKQYVGKADFLVFRAMNQHGFLSQLQEKKLCAVIQLPSQTLLLSVSDKACRLIGMLFPGDMVVFKPQIPGQVSLHQLQQHQQQNQQMQQHPQSQEQQIQHMQQQQTMQQLPQQQFLQLQQQQQSQSQQMVGGGTSQGYLQGSVRPQLVPEGQVPSQGTSPNMAGGGFMG